MCLITQEITKGCDYIVSQPTNLWLANYDEITAWTAGSNPQEFSDVTLASGKYFLKHGFKDNGLTFNAELQVGDLKNVLHTVTVMYNQSTAAFLDYLNDAGLSRVVAIIEWSGRKYIYGRTQGLLATATSFTNTAGGSITFAAEQTEFPAVFTGTVPIND